MNSVTTAASLNTTRGYAYENKPQTCLARMHGSRSGDVCDNDGDAHGNRGNHCEKTNFHVQASL